MYLIYAQLGREVSSPLTKTYCCNNIYWNWSFLSGKGEPVAKTFCFNNIYNIPVRPMYIPIFFGGKSKPATGENFLFYWYFLKNLLYTSTSSFFSLPCARPLFIFAFLPNRRNLMYLCKYSWSFNLLFVCQKLYILRDESETVNVPYWSSGLCNGNH